MLGYLISDIDYVVMVHNSDMTSVADQIFNIISIFAPRQNNTIYYNKNQ